MDKKNRTGLQSKISHIFAGVPIPRKRKHLFDSSEHKEKDEPSALLHPPEDEFSDEEPQTGRPEADTQTIQPEEEQFTAVQDSDIQIETPEQIASKGEIEHEEIEVSQSQSQPERVEEESSFKHLLSPHPPTHGEPQVSMPAAPETKDEKANVSNIPAPPVKEPIVEKPAPSLNQKLEMADSRDSYAMQNLLIGKVPGAEAVKKRDIRAARKITAKPAGKRIKSKAGADQPRQKTMLITAIVLVIILVLVLNKNFSISSMFGSGGSGVIDQPGPVTTITRNIGSVKIDWPEPPVYPDNIRDPMTLKKEVPVEQANLNTQQFIVKGISYVNGSYLVLIDTDLLKVGDEAYGATITKITANSVEFERDGKVWTQKVGE